MGEEAWLLFTDGSSNYRDGSGGWAYLAQSSLLIEHVGCGSSWDQTNNRMEMEALIQGLKFLYETYGPSVILVVTDSEYLMFGCQDRTRKRNKNVDLWLWVDTEIDRHELIDFDYVKGHSGHPQNEIVDKLASEARQSLYVINEGVI